MPQGGFQGVDASIEVQQVKTFIGFQVHRGCIYSLTDKVLRLLQALRLNNLITFRFGLLCHIKIGQGTGHGINQPAIP